MKLLVCSDGSERGSKVLALAGRIAIASRAEVTVFGVTGTEVQEETVYEGLRRAIKEYERNGIKVELVTRRGEPVTEIVKKTRETKYDLVVIGTQRKADERGVIIPAKAYTIIEEVEPPVLVAVGDDRQLARILVCTGGGPCIATAVSVTAQMARSLPAAVTLLTVLPNLGGLHASLVMRREADAEALLRSNSALARDLGSEKRSCKAYTPQTKGKVERTVSHVKQSLWAGINFIDLDDLNRQARAWCERINSRVHRTTHVRPIERLTEEQLQPLPQDYAWERFATEERKVTWDGYISYDGVLYGLPAHLNLAGKYVQVRERKGVLTVWSAGTQVFSIEKRPRSQESVPHPDQWAGVASVSQTRRTPAPLGHQKPAPEVTSRALAEYDQYCGLETMQEVLA